MVYENNSLDDINTRLDPILESKTTSPNYHANSNNSNHTSPGHASHSDLPMGESHHDHSSPQHSSHGRRLSSSSSLSSLSLCDHIEVAQKLVFISPCHVFGEDNGAVVRASILGLLFWVFFSLILTKKKMQRNKKIFCLTFQCLLCKCLLIFEFSSAMIKWTIIK